MKTLCLLALSICMGGPIALGQPDDTPMTKCGSDKIKTIADKNGRQDSIAQVQARLTCYAQQATRVSEELEKARKANEELIADRDKLIATNKKNAEDTAALNLEKDRLSAERLFLIQVWANTSVHQFDWKQYSVDSCKNEAIKAVTARQGIINNQAPTSISFTLKGNTITVECRAQEGGSVTVASHSFGEAVDISRELDDAIFSP